MAAFFDHQVQTGHNVGYNHNHIQWHPTFGLLAVSSFNDSIGGEVNIFLEEGERVRDVPLRKAGSKASCISWHPNKKILAIGWSNAGVSIWNQIDNGEVFTISALSESDIVCLNWSSDGKRLIIADSTGFVTVFKVDRRGCPHSTWLNRNKLKEPIRCVILLPPIAPTIEEKPETIITDETLDTLEEFGAKYNIATTNSDEKTAALSEESRTFFLGGATGGVYCLMANGMAEERFSVERPVIRLLFYDSKNILLTVSEDLMLSQHLVKTDGAVQELSKVKLTGRPQQFQIIWLEMGILAMSSMDNQLRLWDLENEDNCILPLSSDRGYANTDTITHVSYCASRSIIAAGTQLGNVAMWRPVKTYSSLEERWKLQMPATMQHPVQQMTWAQTGSMLAVATGQEVFVLKEKTMCTHMKQGMIAVQTGQKFVTITSIQKLVTTECRPDMAVKGMFLSQNNLCCWDGAKLVIYDNIDSGTAVLIGGFACPSLLVVMYSQNVYVAEQGRIQVRTAQGTVKQTMTLPEGESSVCAMDAGNGTFAVASSGGCLQIYNINRREAKQQFHTKYAAEKIKNFGSVTGISISSAGNRIAFTIRKSDGFPDSKLYVWDAESDMIFFYDFDVGRSDQDEYGDAEAENENDKTVLMDMQNLLPTNCCWDANDGRLLYCEAVSVTDSAKINPGTDPFANRVQTSVASFFITSELGMLLRDAFVMSPVCEKLLGVDTPFIYFTRKSEFVGDTTAYDDMVRGEKPISRYVIQRTCRDFIGLQDADKATIAAMLNFSFYITVGNMDEAFKAIKLIKSESVWENMAQMCVKTQRLDVAAVCLGNMGSARGARMLRKSIQNHGELEAQVACLAVQLGMNEDAKRLFKSCKRFDMLNRVEQASNCWKRAIEICEKFDRVNLRNADYNYAKHLEALGAIQGAIEYYEKSDTHRFEVPRMLFENPNVLEQYVKKRKDPHLQRWWAQYLESISELDAAKNYYALANDHRSVVRLLCFEGRVDEAAKIANETNDRAACYHLARQYEMADKFKEAVHFFTKAQAYTSAIHLCKEHGMHENIAHLALMSTHADMIDAAKFYENKRGHADKAVMLYHKAKMVGRALDLAFRTEQFSALDLIAEELDANSDPLVLERCAEFFVQNQQYTKAVQLLAFAKKFEEGVELCIKRNVPITEQLAEMLTPTREAMPDNVARAKLLEKLADWCMQQGHYLHAAKKYTQAGNKTQAMRALLKSGDTEKIVFFANTARSKDIYVMAGNYLQSLDWKQDPDIMKHIVTFYGKGQAPESLASFYDACAQIEIDDYRDYEKALAALQEAADTLTRGATNRDALQTEEKIANLNRKISIIKRFLTIRETYESDPAEAMKQLQELANTKNVNDAVRLGDIFAVLIIHNVKKENFKKAHAYFEEMRKRMPKLDVHRHIKPQIVEKIHKQLNLPTPKLRSETTENEERRTDEDYVADSTSLKRRMAKDAMETTAETG